MNYRLGQERYMRMRQTGTPIKVQRNYKSARERQRIHKMAFIRLTIAVCAAVAVYLGYGMKYLKAFFPNTEIGGMDASGKTVEEFEQFLRTKADEYTLILDEADGRQERITGKQIGLHIEVNGDLEQILEEQKPYAWIFRIWKTETYPSEIKVTYDKNLLDAAIGRLECMDSDKQIPAVDAHISEYVSGENYSIVPEKTGTQIAEEDFRAAVADAVMNLEETLSLEASGCYKMPAISETDSSLTDMLRQMNVYADVNITYQFGEKQEVLTGERISSWMTATPDGEIAFDEGKIREFVKELADTYNTAYTSRMFQTSYGSEVCVWQGHYGWMIDQEKETQGLMESLLSGESQSREPIYSQTAASHGVNDYGDTYVELNMTAQHLWLYKDGELVLESDFVSGNPAKGYETPTGIYPVTYKERNTRLKGKGYNVGVTYWMPFNKGIGLHDASWRTTFGGTIYKTGGSHGCVNLPPENAKIIYETIEQGTAVICYKLEGTESSSVTNIAPPVQQPVAENAVPDPAKADFTGDAAAEQNIEEQVQGEE